MSVMGEFTIDSGDFALHETLSAAPEMVVEVERLVATSEDRLMPYFWVTGKDHAAFEEAFERDPSITNATRVSEFDDTVLYRAEWTENIEAIIYAYVGIGATILEATGTGEHWNLKMRFDDEETVSDFHEFCRERGVDFELDRLYEQSQPMASSQYGLTPTQRETLVTAYEEGFFDVPQQITMTELAASLGITQQALSKRLHHAHKNLIGHVLTVGQVGEDRGRRD
ncbi:HTH-10 family transcription regulator [Natrialba magadii ATCC 43099]|uniref:Bacterio-opsin activator HTH domain-containing protein n=1 Tax=Natrialba magadii (strain ATCC 43099 / DSM 3394 / CCM 3739 / CIP 104546 / IAM 13178 / JCM 8861 / NBRC 102185 / NCIMB 2190 / MS3) TaxID=547559 RepID=D3SXV5_NATMM|nr:bacterio-opsin activator domain-containing protein [Natrialba magadii]ADD03995.1 HTH-10 family transcription regulator [Natrialba magadii ATCC 43099]ELY33152.1 bacterio-opsin activator HTH domain-containing protein [Natrialba magadii ATCC 43099]